MGPPFFSPCRTSTESASLGQRDRCGHPRGAFVPLPVGTFTAGRPPDVGINYREQDFVEAVREATGGVGADVILDIMGATYLQRNVDALAVNGRLVIIGLQGGAKAELDLATVLTKRVAVVGTTLRARPLAEKAEIVAAVHEHVWPLVEEGVVKPVVDRVLPMAEAAAAHQVLEAGEQVGKVILQL
jgi:NADPH:quinone reductase-like Zn-dependent oxidoreductase